MDVCLANDRRRATKRVVFRPPDGWPGSLAKQGLVVHAVAENIPVSAILKLLILKLLILKLLILGVF